jgi:hypothetical protein
MRHVFTPPVAPGPRRMSEAAAPARLITAAGGAQRVSPGRPGTPFAAINLAAIRNGCRSAPEPDSARTKRTAPSPPGVRRHSGVDAPFLGGHNPPASCLARCRHGADATAKLRSTPCRSPNRIILIAPVGGGRLRRQERRRHASLSRVAQVGKQATPHARRSVARQGTARRARVPLFATWTTLCPSHAEVFRWNQADTDRRRQSTMRLRATKRWKLGSWWLLMPDHVPQIDGRDPSGSLLSIATGISGR